MREQGLGWSSEGSNLSKAQNSPSELKENEKKCSAPVTLKEKRDVPSSLDACEALAELSFSVTPAKAGVQKPLRKLDSGFRRNDAQGLLQEPLVILEILADNVRIYPDTSG